jgi:hypothetical protein
MKRNPAAFFSDINNISTAHWTKENTPFGIPQPWNNILILVVGYGACFLRKFYQNYKRLKHDKK